MTGEQAKRTGLKMVIAATPENPAVYRTEDGKLRAGVTIGVDMATEPDETVRFWNADTDPQVAYELGRKDGAAADAKVWRCFRCDFSTSDRAEAAAHFGERDDADEFLPFCSWWAKLNADERAEHTQDLQQQLTAEQEESGRLNMKCEGLEYRLVDVENMIDSRFPGCRSLNDIYNLYHTMEGRALAAEKLWDLLERRGVEAVYLKDGTMIDPSTDTLRGAVCRLYESEAAKGPRE